MTPPASSRRPLVLLGLLTLATFGGPLGFWAILRGGPRPDWPPDRPVEWVVVGGITALVVALMAATIAVGWSEMRTPARPPDGEAAGGDRQQPPN